MTPRVTAKTITMCRTPVGRALTETCGAICVAMEACYQTIIGGGLQQGRLSWFTISLATLPEPAHYREQNWREGILSADDLRFCAVSSSFRGFASLIGDRPAPPGLHRLLKRTRNTLLSRSPPRTD